MEVSFEFEPHFLNIFLSLSTGDMEAVLTKDNKKSPKS